MTLEIPGYIEERELGSGASGTVMLARHETTHLYAAVKHLSPALCTASFLNQFRAEARLLERIDHPNVTRLYDYREAGGEAAYAMELVNGVALSAMLASGPIEDPCAALVVLKGSLLGLDAAHAVGVVHRDYKPDNVMVDEAGVSKLVDFGVAVPVGDVKWRGGTPRYMAPEAWETGEVSPATDVYAAAAVFLEVLSGVPPFDGINVSAIRKQHETGRIPTDGVPEALQPLALRGLAKAPGDRFGSAGEFLGELEAVAVATYGEDWEERGKKKLAFLVLALAALLPLGAGGGAGAAGASFLGLGTRAAAAVAGGVTALVVAGVLVLASGHDGSTHTAVVVGSTPTTTATAAGTPSPTDAPSGSATAAATSTPTPAPSATVAPAPTPKPTSKPAPTPPPTPTPVPWRVTSITLAYGTCQHLRVGYTCPWTMTVSVSTPAGGTFNWGVDATAYTSSTSSNCNPSGSQALGETGTRAVPSGSLSDSFSGPPMVFTIDPNTLPVSWARVHDTSTATISAPNSLTSAAVTFSTINPAC